MTWAGQETSYPAETQIRDCLLGTAWGPHRAKGGKRELQLTFWRWVKLKEQHSEQQGGGLTVNWGGGRGGKSTALGKAGAQEGLHQTQSYLKHTIHPRFFLTVE